MSPSNIGGTLGLGYDRRLVASTAILSAISIFYLYFVGWFFGIMIYPLDNRVTDNRAFDFVLVTREADQIVLGISTLVWILLSIQDRKKLFLLLAIYGTLAVYSSISLIVAGAWDGPFVELMALSSIPLIAVVLLHDYIISSNAANRSSSKQVLFNLQLYGGYLTLIAFALAVLALIHALTPIVTPIAYFSSTVNNTANQGSDIMPGRNYGHEIFLLTSSISPNLILLLTSSFILKFLIDELTHLRKGPRSNEDKSAGIGQASKQPATWWPAAELFSAEEREVVLPLKLACLVFAILLSIVMVVIPHLPSVNPDGRLIGVDTGYYSTWQAELLESQTIVELLNKVFVEQAGGDRPLSLIVQFATVKLFDSAMGGNGTLTGNEFLPYFIEYLMIVPGSLLVITTFFLTREITQSDRASLFAAFIAAVSFQLLIGMYAGFYANLLALSFGYLSFLFMFKLLRSAELRPSYLAAFIVSFVLLYLSHIYSWTIFAIVTAVFLAIFYVKGKQERGAHNTDLADRGSKDEKPRVILLISIVLVAVLVADIGRSMLTGTQSGIGRDLAIAEESSGATQFLTRWDTIQNTVFVFGGGIIANIIVLGLGLYWLFRSNPQLLASVFLMLFLAAGMIPLVLGDWIVQSRVLFNIPFHIPAGIALSMIVARHKNGRMLLILAVCIWLVAESLISVSNFPGQEQ